MKKKFFQSLFTSLVLLSAAALTACGNDSPEAPDIPEKEEHDPSDEPHEMYPAPGLSFTSVTLPNEGDSFACVIHGMEGYNWDVESGAEWCAVSRHGNILKINASPNSNGGKRITPVYIIDSDGHRLDQIAVIQQPITQSTASEIAVTTKQSFFPMFTATWCPYSPEMDQALEDIQERWKYPILPMRIHVIDSELYTPLSEELSDLYNNSSTPTGYFENIFEVNNKQDISISADFFWNQILANTNDSSVYSDRCSTIGCNATMSGTDITAQVKINPVTSGKYRLLAYILEDGIIRPQATRRNEIIADYCHNAVLAGALTPMTGQEFDTTSSGKIFTLSGKVPENTASAKLRLLIVVERNEALLNYSDQCWFADNCISVPLGSTTGDGKVENIHIGEDIKH